MPVNSGEAHIIQRLTLAAERSYSGTERVIWTESANLSKIVFIDDRIYKSSYIFTTVAVIFLYILSWVFIHLKNRIF